MVIDKAILNGKGSNETPFVIVHWLILSEYGSVKWYLSRFSNFA